MSLHKASSTDNYGGTTEVTAAPTGFFRTEQVDGRWWIITPDGHGFFSLVLRPGRARQDVDHRLRGVRGVSAVFSRPGAVRAGCEYYRHVFSPAGRKASAEQTRRPLTMPILTLGGEYADADNLYHTMRRFSDCVHNQVFAGIGHHLPEECPEEMFEAIERFWRGTRGDTAEPQVN